MTMEQMKAIADKRLRHFWRSSRRTRRMPRYSANSELFIVLLINFSSRQNISAKHSKADPKNLNVRTQLASSLYYGGDIDGALKQLQQVLKSDPKNANALFNLGMMKWKGKDDAAGAIATWQELLRSNPNLDRKATVEQMIAEARAQQGAKK